MHLCCLSQLVANNFVSRTWLMFSRPLCACSSPRHFQQDLAATEEMLHRVLDMFEGVHGRHGDNEGDVGTSGAASRMTSTALSR
jgi:hypothetical protein